MTLEELEAEGRQHAAALPHPACDVVREALGGGDHLVYLMDPRKGTIQCRSMRSILPPDAHLGGVGGE